MEVKSVLGGKRPALGGIAAADGRQSRFGAELAKVLSVSHSMAAQADLSDAYRHSRFSIDRPLQQESFMAHMVDSQIDTQISTASLSKQTPSCTTFRHQNP
jgi:hypothetical protein